MMQPILYFFALIGFFATVIIFSQEAQYKQACDYKNGYTLNDYQKCLQKDGCGSDGSLCTDDNFSYCPEPVVVCKLVKIQS